MSKNTDPAAEAWKAILHKAAVLFGKSDNDRKKASTMLWDGAKAAVETWLDREKKETYDEFAEHLYADLLDTMGTPRKGDASKIKTVALAAKNNKLKVDEFANLSQAYAAAVALTRTAVEHEAEDTAAEEAVSAITAPKSTSTADGAAQMLLANGVEDAVKRLCDALGEHNIDAHRSLLRAMGHEVSERVKAEKAKETKAKTEAADKAKAEKAKARETAKAEKPTATEKPKAAAKPKAEKAEKPKAAAKPKTEPAETPEVAKAEKPKAEKPKVERPKARQAVVVRTA